MDPLTLDEVKAQFLVGSVIVVGPEDGQWRIEHGRVPSWVKVDAPPVNWKDALGWPPSWMTYDLGRETSPWVMGFAILWIVVFLLAIAAVFAPFILVVATGSIYPMLLIIPVLIFFYLDDKRYKDRFK